MESAAKGSPFACGRVAEWSIAAVLKTADAQASVGSNPTPSANYRNRCFDPLHERLCGRKRLMAARTMIRGNSMQILIPTLLLCMGLFIHSSSLLNHDVAWFAWGSREWLHGAVIGKDITDPNFPLAFIIYAPAAALAGTIPL